MIFITYKTHSGGGLFLGMLLILPLFKHYILNLNLTDFMISFIMLIMTLYIGSLLPDIDHPNSHIGKFFPGITSFFRHNNIIHRELTHSLYATLLILLFFLCINLLLKVFFLSLYSSMYLYIFAGQFGILIGYLSHILLDMINPSGVCLLYPLKKRYRLCFFNIINLNSPEESNLKSFFHFFTLLLTLLYLALYLYLNVDFVHILRPFY